MKKLGILSILTLVVVLFVECSSSKKATSSSTTTTPASRFTYAGNIEAIVATKCTPCHIPSKGGNKKAFDTHESVRANIDSIIYRISLNPGDKGYMPFKRPKLSQDTISIFSDWKAGGMH